MTRSSSSVWSPSLTPRTAALLTPRPVLNPLQMQKPDSTQQSPVADEDTSSVQAAPTDTSQSQGQPSSQSGDKPLQCAICLSGLAPNDDYIIKSLKLIKNPFWKEVLESLIEFRGLFDYDKCEALSHPIWYNSNIQVGKNSAFF